MGVTRSPLLRFSDLLARPGESALSYLRTAADGMSLRFYDSGRAALYDGLTTQLGNDASGTVLVPSYICADAMPAFRESTFDVTYYDVDRGSDPDLDDLAAKLTDDTVAVMTVDYFGFPGRRFDEVARLCAEHDVQHIEDAAHAVLSKSESTLLGTRGDWGMISLRKVLPVPDGGVLYTPDDGRGKAERPLGAPDVDFVGRTVVKRVDSSLFGGAVVQRINERAEDGDVEYEFHADGMSPVTGRVLRTADPERIVEQRRRNYRVVADLVADTPGLEALFPDLPDGVCPMAFPVVAADPPRVQDRLQSANVPAKPWPRLPRTVRDSDEFSTANYLSNHVLTIPIHQSLDRFELAERVGSIRTGVS